MERTTEDRLRAEYFHLLPEVRLVVDELETEVKHCILPILHDLHEYERVEIESRIKECESAVDALRRRQVGATFDKEKPELYTLTKLNDLAGVRILVFPRSLMPKVDEVLKNRFPSWTPDPVPSYVEEDPPLALKYHGFCSVSNKVRAEFQIVPMLTGLFWQVEHSAIYKPSPELKGIARSLQMRQRTQEVLDALKDFEKEFEDLIGIQYENVK
jgi:hypothetical protein